jgi:hypothetical protein
MATHPSDADAPHPGAAPAAVGHHHESEPPQAEGCTHSQTSHAAQANCLDFCDKARVSVPTLKSALDAAQGHALSLQAVAVVLPVSAHETVQPGVPRRDGVRAPPIPIAFLRLTL